MRYFRLETGGTGKIEAAAQERLAHVNAQTQAAIESIKTEHERSKNAFEVALAKSRPEEEALPIMWGLLQAVKDHIAITVSRDEPKVVIDRETLTKLARHIKETQSRF